MNSRLPRTTPRINYKWFGFGLVLLFVLVITDFGHFENLAEAGKAIPRSQDPNH